MQYNRIIRMLLTLILTASVLTGCGSSIPHDSTIDSTESEESSASISASEETENPFETGEDSEALGGSSQEFLNVELNEADETIPFTYSGGKWKLSSNTQDTGQPETQALWYFWMVFLSHGR